MGTKRSHRIDPVQQVALLDKRGKPTTILVVPGKTRRHSNNKGERQIKQGKTRTQVDAMAKRLAKSERALLQAVIVAIHPEPSPVFADDLTPTMREMAVTQWRYDRMRAVESAEKAIKVVRRHDARSRT